uniref:Guanylyl cyclase, membrane-like n=1 Tax=Piliocolobus tephrosceles TaxID=591936 RepID=A0A8C9GDW6_9PRIM
MDTRCKEFCENPYLLYSNLEKNNISCICKKKFFIFLICIISFVFICWSMKHYEIYYLKKKFLLRYRQKVNLSKQTEILHTMLPSFIVEYLLKCGHKSDGIMVGKNMSGEDRGIVSIIFCDVDDFQTMVSTLEPNMLVQTLDNLYLYFDKCVKYFNCIKIETVFESYLSASGISEQKNTSIYKIKYDTICAIKLAIAQLSAKNYISYKVPHMLLNDFTKDSNNNTFIIENNENYNKSSSKNIKYVKKYISLKIGIHTGKTISGVIGLVKPQYSLFGDTINTASRMKSTSLTDHIQVSGDTYMYLKDDDALVWKERSVFVKGKGEMKTYLLVDILENTKKKKKKKKVSDSFSLIQGEDTMKQDKPMSGSVQYENLSCSGNIGISNDSSGSNGISSSSSSSNGISSSSSGISGGSSGISGGSSGISSSQYSNTSDRIQLKKKGEVTETISDADKAVMTDINKDSVDATGKKKKKKKKKKLDDKTPKNTNSMEKSLNHDEGKKNRHIKKNDKIKNKKKAPKIINDIFDMYDNNNMYNQSDEDSNSIINNHLLHTNVNNNYKKSKYLNLHKPNKMDRLKGEAYYIFEHPIGILKDDSSQKKK